MSTWIRFSALALLASVALVTGGVQDAKADRLVYRSYYAGPYYAGTTVTYRRPLVPFYAPRTAYYPAPVVYAAPTVAAYPGTVTYYAAPTVTNYRAATVYYGAPVAPLPVPAVVYPLPTVVYPPAVFP